MVEEFKSSSLVAFSLGKLCCLPVPACPSRGPVPTAVRSSPEAASSGAGGRNRPRLGDLILIPDPELVGGGTSLDYPEPGAWARRGDHGSPCPGTWGPGAGMVTPSDTGMFFLKHPTPTGILTPQWPRKGQPATPSHLWVEETEAGGRSGLPKVKVPCRSAGPLPPA